MIVVEATKSVRSSTQRTAQKKTPHSPPPKQPRHESAGPAGCTSRRAPHLTQPENANAPNDGQSIAHTKSGCACCGPWNTFLRYSQVAHLALHEWTVRPLIYHQQFTLRRHSTRFLSPLPTQAPKANDDARSSFPLPLSRSTSLPPRLPRMRRVTGTTARGICRYHERQRATPHFLQLMRRHPASATNNTAFCTNNHPLDLLALLDAHAWGPTHADQQSVSSQK